MGALIRIGALINKNTFKGGRLFGRGALIGRRALNRIITVSAKNQYRMTTGHFKAPRSASLNIINNEWLTAEKVVNHIKCC